MHRAFGSEFGAFTININRHSLYHSSTWDFQWLPVFRKNCTHGLQTSLKTSLHLLSCHWVLCILCSGLGNLFSPLEAPVLPHLHTCMHMLYLLPVWSMLNLNLELYFTEPFRYSAWRLCFYYYNAWHVCTCVIICPHYLVITFKDRRTSDFLAASQTKALS